MECGFPGAVMKWLYMDVQKREGKRSAFFKEKNPGSRSVICLSSKNGKRAPEIRVLYRTRGKERNVKKVKRSILVSLY